MFLYRVITLKCSVKRKITRRENYNRQMYEDQIMGDMILLLYRIYHIKLRSCDRRAQLGCIINSPKTCDIKTCARGKRELYMKAYYESYQVSSENVWECYQCYAIRRETVFKIKPHLYIKKLPHQKKGRTLTRFSKLINFSPRGTRGFSGKSI